jgi:signal transduction histidine kinase
MNLAAAIAIAAGSIAIYVGLVARRFALAPGWGEQRWFGYIAFGAGAYAFGNVATSIGWPDPAVVALSRLQLAAVLAQVWAWFRYVDAWTGRRPGRAERTAVALLLALAILSLMPGLAYDGLVVGHVVPWLSNSYRDAVPTLAGQLLFATAFAAAGVIGLRLVAAWRRGQPHGLLHALAFGCLLLFGLNDGLVASGAYPGAYLLDVGFVIPVGAMAYTLTQRFVRDARSLHALRDRLEGLVEVRTGELAEAQEALHQSEKLAALGQFASGVAHQVNNPASVVTSSLSYLERCCAVGSPPPDAHETIIDALAAMQRINGLVRRLVDAGRLAAVPDAGGSSSVQAVTEQVVDEARARSGERVVYRLEGTPGLHAALRPEVLAQILSALLHNAAESIPEGRDGHVVVRVGLVEDGRVQLAVHDDGVGMTAELQRRAFEPFFTTKGEGKGSGLGLPVARALAESRGGALRLESRPGEGTTALLELPEAAPPRDIHAVSDAPPGPAPRHAR